eukprot:4767235-Amphidinium_carterae.1
MSPRVVNTLRLITKEILSDVGVLEFGDALVDVDAVKLDVLGDGVHDFVSAAVVEGVDVLKEVLSGIGVVELAMPAVAVEHDVLIFGDVLVDVDAVKLDVPRDSVHELIDVDVVQDVDVLKEVLSDAGDHVVEL